MPDHDEIDLATFDYRALTLDQINELKSAAFRRAHEERVECMRSLIRAMGAALAGLRASAHRAWARRKVRRRVHFDRMAPR
jgi:hypothetical protein